MSLPRRKLRQELEYFAHKHPTITDTCKTTLVILSTPICCCICCCCWVGYCGRGNGCVKGAYARNKRARMDIVHWQRKVHTLKRRQSLSIGATTSLGTKILRNKVSGQGACPLFTKIPTEIREMIYKYALVETGAVYWVLQRDWEYRFTVPKAYSCLPTRRNPAEIENAWEHQKFRLSGCALLRTCRLIYTEAIAVLYRNTQFRFNDCVSLHAFSAITPTSRLRTIRSIRIDCESGAGIDNFRAVVRLNCWENLRVIYIADDKSLNGSHEFFDSILAEAENLKYCVFYLLVYEIPPDIGNPNSLPTQHRKLLSYKYVDPKVHSDWRNAEWCMVE